MTTNQGSEKLAVAIVAAEQVTKLLGMGVPAIQAAFAIYGLVRSLHTSADEKTQAEALAANERLLSAIDAAEAKNAGWREDHPRIPDAPSEDVPANGEEA